jgi:S-DNA-T family DNA segregation ATPase FtsK/SpoIIIE
LVDGDVIHVGATTTQAASVRPWSRCLTVATGPDSGRRFTLSPGDSVLGRSPYCDLTVHDPSISREHLRLSVPTTTDAMTVTDLGGGNGSRLKDHALEAQSAVPVAHGDRISVGDSELRLESFRLCEPSAIACGIHIHPAPRLKTTPETTTVDFPAPPQAPARTPFPVLASVAPLIVSVVLATALHQPEVLAFAALSPVMIGAQAVADRRLRRRTAKVALRSYQRATADAHASLAAAVRVEEARRREAAPDLGVITEAIRRRQPPLWQRRLDDSDAMTVRLGVADLPSEIPTTGSPPPLLWRVPVCVRLPAVGVLGLTGPGRLVRSLARAIVLQAATLHAPDDLRIVVIAPASGLEWAWARWLPHVRTTAVAGLALDDEQVTELAARTVNLVDGAVRQPGHASDPRHTLVLIDGCDSPDRLATVDALVRRAGQHLSVIWCAADNSTVSPDCGAVAALADDPVPRLTLTRREQPTLTEVRPDLVAPDVAHATARALAPLRLATPRPGGGLPPTIGWEQLNALDADDPSATARGLVRRWARGPSMGVSLGIGRTGPVVVDLAADGPHTLIAGTTGSGKSEQLLGLVASLVAANRPDDLALLLIDHKGGATFGPCADLPHTTGVLTDLDGESTTRALRSLTAEVRRREAVLAAAGVGDIATYPTAHAMPRQPLPRLLVAVDEFATLADEHPDFVGGLVAIARRGRSLGIHLVLATQRPGGSVSAEIRANTRIRICLAVAADADSSDVIDSPLAARLGPATPGRGYLRVAGGELREFQAARIGGPRMPTTITATTAPVELAGSRPPDAPAGPDSGAIRTLGRAAHEAAVEIDCEQPLAPWLPPLPLHLPLGTLPSTETDEMVPWALADLPAEGRQQPVFINLNAPGVVVIAGAGRSGRTTTARTITTALAARCSPDDLHIWVIDSRGNLADLARLPHCGSVIASGDHDGIDRLLAHLASDGSRQGKPGEEAAGRLLVVDSWEGLASGPDGDRRVEALLRLAAEAPSIGLHVVVTADRTGLTGRLGSVAQEKVALRLTDPADFTLLGVPAREVPVRMPPGRGIRAHDRSLLQVAEPDAASLDAANCWPAPNRPVRGFEPLPTMVSLADLVRHADDSGDRGDNPEVLLGVSADDLAAVRLRRSQIGPGFLVVGPTGSGRTNALAVLAQQFATPGRRLAVSAPVGSPLLTLPEFVELPRDDSEHAVALLDALTENGEAPPDIVVDDADQLDEGPLWHRIEALLRRRSDPTQVIALASSTDRAALAFRGPLAQARQARNGLVLAPSAGRTAELFGQHLTNTHRPPANDPVGRAMLIHGDSVVQIQIAMSAAGSAIPAGVS